MLVLNTLSLSLLFSSLNLSFDLFVVGGVVVLLYMNVCMYVYIYIISLVLLFLALSLSALSLSICISDLLSENALSERYLTT